MDLETLLKEARKIWGDRPQTLEHIVICMGKTYGDIAKQARNKLEYSQNSQIASPSSVKGETLHGVDEDELKKELGNMIFSTLRWADDLGLDIEECLKLALASQQNYKTKKQN